MFRSSLVTLFRMLTPKHQSKGFVPCGYAIRCLLYYCKDDSLLCHLQGLGSSTFLVPSTPGAYFKIKGLQDHLRFWGSLGCRSAPLMIPVQGSFLVCLPVCCVYLFCFNMSSGNFVNCCLSSSTVGSWLLPSQIVSVYQSLSSYMSSESLVSTLCLLQLAGLVKPHFCSGTGWFSTTVDCLRANTRNKAIDGGLAWCWVRERGWYLSCRIDLTEKDERRCAVRAVRLWCLRRGCLNIDVQHGGSL